MKSLFLALGLLLARGAQALPAESSPPSDTCVVNSSGKFTVVAARGGSPIQYLAMAARGQAFFLGLPSTTYCPSSVGALCPNGTQTVFEVSGGACSLVSYFSFSFLFPLAQ